MHERLHEQYYFVRKDIEEYDKKPLMLDTMDCVVNRLDNKCRNNQDLCAGCDHIIQCTKFHVVIDLFGLLNKHQMHPLNFQSAVPLIIKECKTLSEIIFIANYAIT